METKKLNFISLLLGFSGFGAGAISVNEMAQILGAVTGAISALAVAYQVVISANAQSALTFAQAEKEKAEADKIAAETDKIEAETEKQQIENDNAINSKNKRK